MVVQMEKKILLVEDEKDTREAVCEFLEKCSYIVDMAEDGEEAIEKLKESVYDMVLLDIMLPKVNGFVILHWLRKQSTIPVIMLTAMNDEYPQIMSFDEQADDYITKPFSLLLLEKRMQALFRRISATTQANHWIYKDVEVDFQGFNAYYKQESVDLKPKEIQLLHFLFTHANQVMTREQMLDYIWKDVIPNDRVIDVYIKNIRKKLKLDCIITIKGIGYKLEEQL